MSLIQPIVEAATNVIRTEDNEKLREKVNEALAVYNDYAKTQGTDMSKQQDPATETHFGAEGEDEEPKA